MMTQEPLTAVVKAAAAARPMPSLTEPAGLEDMLDYQLYLLYRDCGYVLDRLCQVEFGVSRRRWRVLAILASAEGITVSALSKRGARGIPQAPGQSEERAICAGCLDREGAQPLPLDACPLQ
jgi:hypothetical protein